MVDEYIRKQDASNWLKQYGQDVLHGKYEFSLMYIWKNIMDLPAADVAPVVRCTDCKNVYCRTYQNWQEPIYTCTRLRSRWNTDYDLEVSPDDFCSYGERKE